MGTSFYLIPVRKFGSEYGVPCVLGARDKEAALIVCLHGLKNRDERRSRCSKWFNPSGIIQEEIGE
jgi:hypothetical protein